VPEVGLRVLCKVHCIVEHWYSLLVDKYNELLYVLTAVLHPIVVVPSLYLEFHILLGLTHIDHGIAGDVVGEFLHLYSQSAGLIAEDLIVELSQNLFLLDLGFGL
jgi:hypothetical protein